MRQCNIRRIARDAYGFSALGMLLIVLRPGSHGNNLPNRRMQE